ncbi:GrpB family protein [Paenisporosarcina quisquiliarum]|uniref:GrpB family protein n=1 Tax=Paenisporosarcina quisquiliarum TaxID=365346 RepID=A0A9X3LIQ7_9BACL|nr:GrpB family protein [Paenisporosarcina quisquiliarum]
MNSDDHNNIPVWAFEAIEIKKPNPLWKNKGIQEKEELYILLSPFGVKQIEHIGSTAIPNLSAKPIIDLMASIPSLEQINKIAEHLLLNDWHYVPPELDKQHWRRFFVKVKNDKFRNKLRTNPHLVEEYANLKSQLAQEFNKNREGYTEAKTDFINKVIFN